MAERFNKSSIQIQDLVGTAEVALIEAAIAFDPKNGSKFSSFACIIISRALIDYISRNQIVFIGNAANRRRVAFTSDIDDERFSGIKQYTPLVDTIESREDSVEQILCNNSVSIDLENSIKYAGLTQKQTRVIKLFLEGKELKQIAKLMGNKLKTTQIRFNNAVKKLKDYISSIDDNSESGTSLLR